MKRLADGRECIVDTSVRLDTFQAKFTSEDNASFEQIVKKDKALRAEKEWYIEAQQLVHNAELADQQIAVNDGEFVQRAASVELDPSMRFRLEPVVLAD